MFDIIHVMYFLVLTSLFPPRYDNYPTHCSTDFLDPATNNCRIAKVDPGNKKGLGAASLNLTNIQEGDRGWYNCKVIHLNRHPGQEAQDNVSYISLKLQFVMIGWLQ